MRKEVLSSKNIPAPGGHYSQAIKLGDLLFTSGQTAKDVDTREVLFPGDIEAQTDVIMKNIETLLKECGSSLANIVKTSVFINDQSKFLLFNNAYKKYFPENPPVRTTVATGQFDKGICIEIDVIAFVDKD
jgi:2-iminobutanoate/2-iminopropanoate deaminase